MLGAQPALLRDVAPTDAADDLAPGIAAEVADLDGQILTELRGRYTALREAAQQLLDELVDALTAADQAALGAALWRAVRWGVTPTVEPDRQPALFAAMLDGVGPADPAVLPDLARRARDALAARLDAAPAVDARVPIGRSIAELAAPEGRLAVLAKVPAAALARIAGLTTAADPGLDTGWLPVVAAVRPPLARLEAFQLRTELTAGAAAGCTGCSSAPGDHWQTDALARLLADRAEPDGDPRSRLPRFVAAYGLGVRWNPGETIAIGLVDAWSEAVPRTRQTGTAAFGFNAPAARPPQAILLAVPPDPDTTAGAPMEASELVAHAGRDPRAGARAGRPSRGPR